ncbi:MAG: SIMPL domain-containing protein [Spirochaetaceae bacterium]|nr:SIMPL domain-containing protein [Spirochaetaceae bacterium]
MINTQRKIAVYGLYGVLALAVILGAGCSVKETKPDTVEVSATGTVMIAPDTVQINILYSNVAPTTKQAKDVVDKQIGVITGLLTAEGVAEKDVHTIALSYQEENEYRNGVAVRVGQRAEQALAVTIHDIINNPGRFPALLDKLSEIDRVVVNNIRFDVDNKTEHFKQARELAFKKAAEKAAQYAELSGHSLGTVLSIVENRERDVVYARQQNTAYAAVSRSAQGAAVPAGEQEISTDITVIFKLK